MKKFFKMTFMFVIIMGVIGYGVYHFGTNIASEKVADKITNELHKSGKADEVKKYVESDPELKKFVKEAESADQTKLPFTTKEEATKVLIKKVGISELHDIQTKAQSGTISKEEVLQKLEDKLTKEEMTALKVIAYKELYNK